MLNDVCIVAVYMPAWVQAVVGDILAKRSDNNSPSESRTLFMGWPRRESTFENKRVLLDHGWSWYHDKQHATPTTATTTTQQPSQLPAIRKQWHLISHMTCGHRRMWQPAVLSSEIPAVPVVWSGTWTGWDQLRSRCVAGRLWHHVTMVIATTRGTGRLTQNHVVDHFLQCVFFRGFMKIWQTNLFLCFSHLCAWCVEYASVWLTVSGSNSMNGRELPVWEIGPNQQAVAVVLLASFRNLRREPLSHSCSCSSWCLLGESWVWLIKVC